MAVYLSSSFCFTTEVFLTLCQRKNSGSPYIRKCGSRIFKSSRYSTEPIISLLRSLSGFAHGACLDFSSCPATALFGQRSAVSTAKRFEACSPVRRTPFWYTWQQQQSVADFPLCLRAHRTYTTAGQGMSVCPVT